MSFHVLGVKFLNKGFLKNAYQFLKLFFLLIKWFSMFCQALEKATTVFVHIALDGDFSGFFPGKKPALIDRFCSDLSWSSKWLWSLIALLFSWGNKDQAADWSTWAVPKIDHLLLPIAGNQPACYLGLFSHFSIMKCDSPLDWGSEESALRSNSIWWKSWFLLS